MHRLHGSDQSVCGTRITMVSQRKHIMKRELEKQEMKCTCPLCNITFQQRNRHVMQQHREDKTGGAGVDTCCQNRKECVRIHTLLINSSNELQLIQSSAAWVLTETKKEDHITHIVRSLHWLPVHLSVSWNTWHIQIKVTYMSLWNPLNKLLIEKHDINKLALMQPGSTKKHQLACSSGWQPQL